MKKYLFLFCALAVCVGSMAQLRVKENGSIGLGALTIMDNYRVSTISNSDIYRIVRSGTPTDSDGYTKGIELRNISLGNSYNIGIRSQTYSSSALGTGRAYGLWGVAGNTTSGYNYGVFGQLYSSQNGAAVYGTTSSSDYGVDVGGRYAGYFNGDVKVSGSLSASVLTTTAATASNTSMTMTLADNESTTGATVSEKLSQLSTIQYSLNNAMPLAATPTVSDTMTVTTFTDIELQALEKNHYGLLATQLQELYPDLVYENQQGELSINYIEMIPLLVESIKELKAEIADLQGGNNGGVVMMSRSTSGTTSVEETALTIPTLEQNNPNPFTENTVIGYTLPESVKVATIYIYDMNGIQLLQYPLSERGSSSVTINGGELKAGMYLYSLIADGKVIDTKRMILTK